MLLSLLFCFTLIGCIGLRSVDAERALKLIAASDLQHLHENISEEFRKDQPRYELVEWQEYDIRESVFQYRAVVDYYYQELEPVNFKVRRMYRFHAVRKQWERYYNEFYRIDTASHSDK